MADENKSYIELFYKCFFQDDNKKEEKPYYFCKIQIEKGQSTITKNQLKTAIREDGYNANYFNLIDKWEYSLSGGNKYNFKKSNGFNNDDNLVIQLDGESPYKLHLHLIIDTDLEKKERKKESEEEKNRETDYIKTQNSNIEQISNELYNIKKQIQYISIQKTQMKEVNEYKARKGQNKNHPRKKSFSESQNLNLTSINEADRLSKTSLINQKISQEPLEESTLSNNYTVNNDKNNKGEVGNYVKIIFYFLFLSMLIIIRR